MFDTIVAPTTLQRYLGDASWVAVDCRFNLQDREAGRRAYDAGHIPGAFYADLERDLAGAKTGSNGRHPLPDPQAFAALLQTFGVEDTTQVVAYDDGGDMYAARLWFLCRWIGHDRAAVLDGGMAAWRDAGYSVSHAPALARSAAPALLSIDLRPDLVARMSEVSSQLSSSAMQIVDARSGERFRGESEPLDRAAGHIPGARNRWYKENYDEHGRFKSPERLRSEFARFGAPENIVNQCGSGVSASVNALAMEIAGLHNARLYAGSWSEWSSDPSRPVETGPERAL